MAIKSALIAILTILFGILVIAFPNLLRWMIGFYLIITGVLFFIPEF